MAVRLSSALAALLLLPLTTVAATFNFDGAFQRDDDVLAFLVTLNSPGTLSAYTTSFATGGFSPVISVFEAGGLQPLIGLDYAGAPGGGVCGPNRATDAATGFCWDAHFSANLNSGSYIIALTQDDNTPLNAFYSDGFLRSGTGNFTGPAFAGQEGRFFLINGVQRTGDWALTIDGVDAASRIPEPASLLLFGSAAASLTFWRRIRRRPGMRTGALVSVSEPAPPLS